MLVRKGNLEYINFLVLSIQKKYLGVSFFSVPIKPGELEKLVSALLKKHFGFVIFGTQGNIGLHSLLLVMWAQLLSTDNVKSQYSPWKLSAKFQGRRLELTRSKQQSNNQSDSRWGLWQTQFEPETCCGRELIGLWLSSDEWILCFRGLAISHGFIIFGIIWIRRWRGLAQARTFTPHTRTRIIEEMHGEELPMSEL
jgi:hypothetical protein